MKLAIANEHRVFFHKHKFLELEKLLNIQQTQIVAEEIEHILTKRLQIAKDKLETESPEKLFYAGRDLWRESESLKKITAGRLLAGLASDLIEKKPIRLGYDQLFSSHLESEQEPDATLTPYQQFMQTTPSLSDISCIQGVLCGLMICLPEVGDTVGDPAMQEGSQGVFTDKLGNGIFFDCGFPLNFNDLKERRGRRYLMIVYTQSNSVYVLRKGDLLTHALKNEGYHFGDRLSDKRNPILFR